MIAVLRSAVRHTIRHDTLVVAPRHVIRQSSQDLGTQRRPCEGQTEVGRTAEGYQGQDAQAKLAATGWM